LTWGYLLSKDQENTVACFRDHANLKFLFLPPFDYNVFICICHYYD